MPVSTRVSPLYSLTTPGGRYYRQRFRGELFTACSLFRGTLTRPSESESWVRPDRPQSAAASLHDSQLEFVAINDLKDAKTLAYLLKYARARHAQR